MPVPKLTANQKMKQGKEQKLRANTVGGSGQPQVNVAKNKKKRRTKTEAPTGEGSAQPQVPVESNAGADSAESIKGSSSAKQGQSVGTSLRSQPSQSTSVFTESQLISRTKHSGPRGMFCLSTFLCFHAANIFSMLTYIRDINRKLIRLDSGALDQEKAKVNLDLAKEKDALAAAKATLERKRRVKAMFEQLEQLGNHAYKTLSQKSDCMFDKRIAEINSVVEPIIATVTGAPNDSTHAVEDTCSRLNPKLDTDSSVESEGEDTDEVEDEYADEIADAEVDGIMQANDSG
ncbi:hypothetical protein N0V87_008734 [Didymella glomerata]|uniref:Uncharacterized protein n=1 Tax=Didymella glomerata TaxID=749621 RepID=A0A9W8WT38_9PLEO|nr:hypothetical protein N0V87_008734 [Didymella glomerata]